MKAVIIDMSGVLINTTTTEKKAWNKVFNPFLRDHNARYLFNEEDYETFFEGKPKYERVQNYLDHRNIHLPTGKPDDSPGYHSVYGLEKKKSKVFTHMLNKGELKIYEKALQKIKFWREQGLKVAVVSSDENFKKALATLDIEHFFDVIIERHASRKKGLKEKPEADLYIQAVKELGLAPESCVLIDDSVQGLRAGSKGNFGLVVGVNRGDNRVALSENGADIVIDNFDDL
ncbi:MAG: HAD family hydrolase, partial [Bacteroidota bacterium]